MALSGHELLHRTCPLSGAKRKWRGIEPQNLCRGVLTLSKGEVAGLVINALLLHQHFISTGGRYAAH
jgi:hypothetical protein